MSHLLKDPSHAARASKFDNVRRIHLPHFIYKRVSPNRVQKLASFLTNRFTKPCRTFTLPHEFQVGPDAGYRKTVPEPDLCWWSITNAHRVFGHSCFDYYAVFLKPHPGNRRVPVLGYGVCIVHAWPRHAIRFYVRVLSSM